MALSLLLAALLAATPASALSESTMTVRVDPRIELLGVVQLLAGRHRPGADVPAYQADAERAFAALKDRPAVRSYAALAAKPRGEEGLAVLVFCMTDPPALDWKIEPGALPAEHVDLVGGLAEAERLRSELRAFAREPAFARFLSANREFYDSVEDPARKSAAGGLERIEAYLGPLQSRLNVVLSPLYRSHQLSYIVPYPIGAGAPPHGPFEVTTVMDAPRLESGRPVFDAGGFWHELICVFTDPILKDHCGELDAARLLQAGAAKECQPDWLACATNLLNRAVLERLGAASGRPDLFGASPWPATPYGDDGRALTSSLEEYEKNRTAYPAFDRFYPRAAAVFTSLAKNGPGLAEASGRCAPPGGDRGAVSPLAPKTAKERGVWDFAHGRAEDALRELDRAVAENPEDAEARLDRGVALDRLGRAAEALEDAEEALRLAEKNGDRDLAASARSTRDSLRARAK